MKPLRICLDARLISGASGGVEQFILGLAGGLSNLDDGNEEYFFLAYQHEDDWLRPYVYGPCKLIHVMKPRQKRWKQTLKLVPGINTIWHTISPLLGNKIVSLPGSESIVETAAVDIMHFTKQSGFLTVIPSIYHPHDLQHLHLPQHFSPRERLIRETVYRTLCKQATMVAVGSSWVKRDIINQYEIDSTKVHVVPLAPVNTAYPNPSAEEVSNVQKKFSLPDSFIFYPAQTWAHKNHIGLLEALALLRDQYGIIVPFVSSGRHNDFYPQIRKRILELRLTDQVYFLGFVTPLELQCLYKLCRCIVIPSKFEAASFPLWEAFVTGVPAACSNITSLPEQAGNAALVFNPYQPREIADVIQQLWHDEDLRKKLVDQGKKNVARFTWDRTARTFRAHYRRIGGRPLTEEDCTILSGSPLL